MSTQKIIVSEDRKTVYMPDAKAIGRLPASASTNTGGQPAGTAGAQPSSPITSTVDVDDIIPWGNTNRLPQDILKAISKNTIVITTLTRMAKSMYGSRLDIGRVTGYKEDGTEIFVPDNAYQPWKDFVRRSNINRYRLESSNDFVFFANVFPELIFTKDHKQVFSINSQEASYCRLGKQNKKGAIEKCYINAQWETGATTKDPETIPVGMIDPYNDPVSTVKTRDKDFKLIYPLSYPSPGKTFYQLAHWNTLIDSGWLDIAQSIPQIKKAALNNAVFISYIIEVADWYWPWKYPDWETNTEEQPTRITESYQAFNDFVAGKDNAGKALFVPVKTNPITNEPYPGWKVTPVERNSKEGHLLQDSHEANSHLLYALGFDPTIIGFTPGSQMGAGSGSDKRVAFNIYVSLLEADKDILLEPFNFIRDYNGWDDTLQFRIRYPMITSLDKGKETQQQSS